MEWFRKLFYKKKTIEEAKAWLQEEQSKHDSELQQSINAGEQEFPALVNEAKQAVQELEKAQLRNPNIPERAKHFMQGNREQFIRLTSKFIENIFIPKNATDTSQTNLLFHQYAQNTTRPATILSEFFAEEVKKVRSSLAAIEEKIISIKKIQAQKEQLQQIQETIQKIHDTQKEKETIEKQQAEFQAQVQQLTNKRETLKKEKEEFTTRPEYLKVKDDILATARERQEAEQAITGLFLALSDAIKKYSHKTKNDKLAKYAEQPVEALIKDYALGILKHKEDLAKAINSGELELKPEKTQKAQEAVKQLTKENLSAMIHRYAKAKKREADIHNDVAQRPIMKEYEQYAVDLKTLNAEIEQLEKTIAKLATPSDEQLKEELKQQLAKLRITLVL